MSRASSLSVVNEYIQELLDQLPGVRGADAESVHQARVATRRLREVIPLLRVTHPDWAERIRRSGRAIGRQLGRVRELDILRGQLAVLEERVPSAAATIAAVRRALHERQNRRRRRAIKALEKLKVDRLRPLAPGDGRLLARMRPHSTARATCATLRMQIRDRARDVQAAADRAAGIYFPNRLHAVRVAVKKLRYSVEAADRLALWRPPRLLRDLRRVQARLGEIHDLQMLSDTLDDLARPISRKHATLLTAIVGGDIAREHVEYARRMDRLRAICEACERFASRPTAPERRIWPATAAAVAAHLALNLVAEKLASDPQPGPRAAGQVLRVMA